jgi:hypothetical protein
MSSDIPPRFFMGTIYMTIEENMNIEQRRAAKSKLESLEKQSHPGPRNTA